MKFNIKEAWRFRTSRFLDGPETFQLHSLQGSAPRKYRSSTLALFAWIFGISRLFLSTAGFYLVPAIAMLTAYASVAMDAPMRVMVLVFVAVFTVDLVLGFWWRPKVEIVRTMPDRVRAGSHFKISYQLRNRRRFSAWDLQTDPFNYAPGLSVEKPARIRELPALAEKKVEALVHARRRGRYLIYTARVESNFPFNLIKWSCSVKFDSRILSVYPAFTTLSKFSLPLGARSQSEGMARYSKIGESMELMGVRDYREGDDVRRIDWSGSARLSTFVVKEFEEDQLKRIALVTDTFVPPIHFWSLRRAKRESMLLEAALELTAALAEYLARGEAKVDLFAVGPEVYHIETGRSTTDFDTVCDILSGIEPSREPALNKLAPEVFRDLSDVGGAVVVLIGDDDDRRKFVNQLRESGVSLRVFLITTDPAPDLPPDWFALTPKAIRSGQVREL